MLVELLMLQPEGRISMYARVCRCSVGLFHLEGKQQGFFVFFVFSFSGMCIAFYSECVSPGYLCSSQRWRLMGTFGSW